MALCDDLAGLVAPYTRRSAARVVLAVALTFVAMAAPRVLGRADPIFVTVSAFALVASAFRVYAILIRPDSTPRARLASTSLLLFDARRIPNLPRVPRALRVDWLVTGLFELAVAVFLFVCCDWLPPAALYSRASMLRTFVAGASAYFVVEGTARVVEMLGVLFGYDIGTLHDAPIRARTVGEFWGRRWNRAVHGMLHDVAFRPVAKRFGATAGVMSAFVASAVLHFVPVIVAYDARWAIAMGAFFVAHGALVVAETKLHVARWPRALGHAWTLGWFAITLPLFVEPLLRSLGR